MKNLIALFCVASAVTALADTPAASDNVFGVLRVDIGANTKEAIIAVPWLDPGTGNDIKVTDVIKTANLDVGTQLFYYNTSTKIYQVWNLGESSAGKTWTAATDPENPTPEQTLSRGNAILLRAVENGTLPSSVYLYGQVATSAAGEVVLAEGTATMQAYTLIAPPTVSETDLNTGATWKNVNAGDSIVISTSPSLKLLVWDVASSKWGIKTGYDSTKNANTYDYSAAKISAGQGAWYSSARRPSQGNPTTVTWLNTPKTEN